MVKKMEEMQLRMIEIERKQKEEMEKRIELEKQKEKMEIELEKQKEKIENDMTEHKLKTQERIEMLESELARQLDPGESIGLPPPTVTVMGLRTVTAAGRTVSSGKLHDSFCVTWSSGWGLEPDHCSFQVGTDRPAGPSRSAACRSPSRP